uniref:Saccharopine dehydrogenase NADP binding domain-containing protein n=1 Tax=Pseudo-nitzschia australis TaxID=44445 RepID=A0A7S4APY8_9STRA
MSNKSSPSSMSCKTKEREWDLVIYGATGDTGMAMAMYVANNVDNYSKLSNENKNENENDSENDQQVFRWAIAGRSESKLNGLRSKIIVGRSPPSTTRDEIGVLTADSASPEETNRLAKSARIIVSAVGPYTRLGENVYAACVENGTNYVDITGEVDWVMWMRAKYGERAGETGSTLCSFAGYDCVPCDITMYAARRVLSECDSIDGTGTGTGTNDNKDTIDSVSLSSAETVVKVTGGAFPRGTIRTMISKFPDGAKFCSSLIRFASSEQEGAHRNTTISLVRWLLPRWSPEYGAFTLPDFMGWCNIPVVFNSSPSSIDCTYHDRVAVPYSQGCPGTGYGLLQTVILYSFLLAMAPLFMCFQIVMALVPSTADLLLKLFDALQYRGNTQRNQKHLNDSTVDAWTYATSALSGSQAQVHLHVNGDAGIKSTAVMACETAFAILELEDKNELPRGMIGSPSMIAGDALVDRLQNEDVIGDICTLSVTVIDNDNDNDNDGSSDNNTKKEN